MSKWYKVLGVFFAGLAAAAAVFFVVRSGGQAPAPITDLPGPVIPDFTLLDHEGGAQSLYREAGARAIVIIGHGNACPIVQKYAIRIRQLAAEYSDRGVAFFMLNANTQDSRASIIREDQKFQYGLPILMDPSQAVARLLGIDRTAEAVIINPRTWKVVYKGAIDDRLSYGADKQEPRHNYLQDALEDLLARRPIAAAPPPARGCAITFRDDHVSYAKHVAPVLREKCLNCHSQQGFYPPFFDSYETVKGWGAMIGETLHTDRMPPWSADPLYGTYLNDISLSPEQKHVLLSWIRKGMPRGEGQDPLLAGPAKVARPRLPPKVWEVAMKEPAKIDPKGTVEYQFFEVGGPAPYDMWVTAMHTTSTNPVQLHHESMLITSKPLTYYLKQLESVRDPKLVDEHPDGDVPLWTMAVVRQNEQNKDENYLRFGAWAAGRPQPSFMQHNTAIFIPKGYYAILEVHYVGSGKADTEQTKVEFFGYRERGSLRPLRTMQVANTDFEVPAGQRSLAVKTRPHKLERDIMVTGLLSHMHMRGKAVRLQLEEPGQEPRTIASIPNFDFNWQSGFPLTLEKPMLVRKGGRLRAICEFDNSPYNPLNPDATRSVRHGQTLDRAEMCKFMVSYYYKD